MDLADLGARRVLRRHRSDARATGARAAGARVARAERGWRARSTTACASSRPTSRFSTRSRSRRRDRYDAFVAVGGGSAIDTAKAVNLYTTYPPADFLDYVNPPIGKGLPVPGPLKPLIAIPTTAGTGSETTGVTIFDYSGCTRRPASPTGGSSRRSACSIRTTRARMPPQVAASTGLDILSHAVESFTAMPFTDRPRPDRPALRPAYQGSNPISDVWSLQALRMVAQYLVRAVDDPGRRRGAREHAAGGVVRRRRIRQRGRAPAARHVVSGVGPREELSRAGLRRRSSAGAARHVGDPECAGGVPVHRVGEPAIVICRRPRRWAPMSSRARREDAGKILADRITWFMQRLHMPNGLRGDRLLLVRHSRARRGDAAAASRDEAVAAAGGARRAGALFEDAMVAW